MTTWTTISNAAVAVGAIPSSSTVTALRDNTSAVAESSSGAPVVVSGWHPVDKVTIGDGKTGLIYDSAVTGTVSSVITPDFVDGYEYMLLGDSLTHAGGATTRALYIQLYQQTSASYVSARESGSVTGTTRMSFRAEIVMPRLSTRMHFMPNILGASASISSTMEGGVYDGTAQKILRARVIYDGFNITGGQIWLFRRREYASSP